jgi:pimeloyl-ACP methyl ester carboxylesterase
MSTYLLVHGAWHTGKELEPVAELMRAAGHMVYSPTVKGNRPGDAKTIGLAEAVESMVDYLSQHELEPAVLVGHSYGGMIIRALADRLPRRIRRLVYWNAFVPNNGESVADMLTQQHIALFDSSAAERGDGSVMLPFEVWREAFINHVDFETARRAYSVLNPHPLKTLKDKISLSVNPAEMTIPKSYINGTGDTSLPHHCPWHPRLSQKLGLFRLIQIPGSHELCFSNPPQLARAIMDAGRD